MATTIRFPKELLERVKSAAEGRGFSVNTLLKLAAHEWLERHPLLPHHPVSARQPAPGAVRKIGRNEPCWCGSGKKFKLCHGKAQQ